jgi:hypothetical protein
VRASVALAALLLSHVALAAGPGFVDFVHIEANEGGSSGGHAAIRFGDDTYHFQHERPGLLRLRRDDWQHFRYAYGVLENRTMHVSRAAVPAPTYARLRQRFGERYLIERKLFQHRDDLRDDSVLLALLLARRRGDTRGALRLRGTGFFVPDAGRSPPAARSGALRRRVEDLYGRDAIPRRRAEVRRELERLTPAPPGPSDDELPAEVYPAFAYPFATRYRDLLTNLIALDVLEHAPALRRDARWPAAAVVPGLDAAERGALTRFAERLTDEVAHLVRSERPDWGFALLVGMARLAALRESEESGRLVLLDAFPPAAGVMPRARVRQHEDAVMHLLADARDDLAHARTRLRAAEAMSEAQFAELEAAGNRLLELEAAIVEQRDLRLWTGPPVPSRDAQWSELVVPDVPAGELESGLARATAAEERFAARLARDHGYDLVGRNCASEIFRTVDTAGAEPGGHVDPRRSLAFIPFMSARAVNGAWDVVERTTLPSYRSARLDDMYRRENPLRAWLRECNVVTSTIYRRNPDDSVFLLFTDDALAPRPIFGAVNLAAGLGAGALGLALLPVDRGEMLLAGLRGAVFSLPELAFVSLRKGSFEYVEPADQLAP